jgi:hypothetical protein
MHISGGPTHGRCLAWAHDHYDDMARFCFELEWIGPPDHDPFLQVYPEWIAITYVFAVIGAMSLSATTRSGA